MKSATTSGLPRVMIDGSPPDYLRGMLTPHAHLVPWQQIPGPELGDVQGIFTYEHPPVDGQLMDALPACCVISNHGVGVDHIDVPAARMRGIPVGNTPGVLDGAVADHAFALLLAAARRLPESIRLAAAPETVVFDQSKMHGQEVYGSTLGILGLGRIGQQIARRGSEFQMRVLYHNRRRRPELEDHLHLAYVSFDDLLQQSDFLVVVVPLNSETKGMIGAAQLGQMRPTATLINVARGAIVDTQALVRSLQAGVIRAAALDVTDPEPLPRGHPLLHMDNAIVASHIGSATVQTRHKMAALAAENLLCGLRGEPLTCSV